MKSCTSNGTEVAVQHDSTPLPTLRPAADIVERDEAFLVTLDLPGVAESDIEIRHERSLLTVSATRRRPDVPEERVLFREFGPARFSRTFRLPEDGTVDTAQIGARLQAGVLEITLPKAAEAKPRRIPVN